MEQPKVNLFDMYFELVKDTEPPLMFHRWSLLACVGAMLGRQLWLPFGSSRLFPNQYIIFVGDPGTRKSTAIKAAAKIIAATGYESFGAQRTSKEKFLMDLAGEEGEHDAPRGKRDAIDILSSLNLSLSGEVEDNTPREMFVAADEFRNFIGVANVDFHSLLGELWDWDDQSRPFKQRLKNSKSIAIYQPTVSILGGTTPSQFSEIFPLASIGQGFMSRLLLIHAEPSGRKITIPPPFDEALTAKIVSFLQVMKATCVGPMTITPEAESALDLIYRGWAELEDSRFKHYSTRRFTHLLKLCMLIVAMRLSTELAIVDVIHANTLLAFAETTMPKAIGELGKSKHSEAANKIMQILYSARDAKTVPELWRVVQNDLDKIGDLAALLINLQQADKIQVVKNLHGKDGYLAKQKAMSLKAPFTNFDILKGRELK